MWCISLGADGTIRELSTLSSLQARTLMTLMYAFYTDPVSFLHVHNFNHSPEEFSFEAMLAELGIGQRPPG